MIRDMFKNFVYKDATRLDQRGHEEMVAQLCLRLETDPPSLKKSGLDEFYENTFYLSDKTKSKVRHILTVSAKMSKTKKISKRWHKGKLNNLWELINLIEYENNYKILEFRAMLDWFLDKDIEFGVIAKGITEEDQEEKSYTYWTKFFNKRALGRKIRCLFEDVFLTEAKSLLAQGVIAKKRTWKDYFTFDQKMELYISQGKMTRDGVPISALDLYAGEYDAGHLKSFKNDGTTEIFNGELQEKSVNRSNREKDFNPHFDFQKEEKENVV